MSMGMARQALVIALAGALAALWGEPTFTSWLCGYLVSVLCLHVPVVRGALDGLEPRVMGALALLLALPSVAWSVRAGSELVAHEGLHGITTHVADRVRLQTLPAIAPPLLAADRPQAFFVATQQAESVRVRFGAQGKWLQAQSLGGGLFRVDYDPRRDGAPSPPNGPLEATLDLDGDEHVRAMTAVTPLAHPRWFARSTDGALAATVSRETDELLIVGKDGLRSRIAVGDGPVACAFVDASHVAVAHAEETALWVVDIASGERSARVELGARQSALAASDDGSRLLVATVGAKPGVSLLAVAEQRLEPLAALSLPAAADWLAFGADAQTSIVATRADAALHRVRVTRDGMHVESSLRLGRPVVTLARSRDGQEVFVATTDFRSDDRAQLGNHFVQDQILRVETASLRVLQRELTARRSERQSKPGDVDRGLSPMGMWHTEEGALLVVFAGSDELWRMLPDATSPEILDLVDTDLHAPHGIVQLADGTRVISSPAYAAIGVLAPGARAPRVTQLAHDEAWLLAHDRNALARRVGERGFYEGTRAGIACQSCHLHGDSDHAAYNLGDHRLVPTLSVLGLLGTAPYLRDGSYAHIADLDEVAQTLYRGYLRNQAARGETLESYVSALPRVRSALLAHERDAAAEQRGYTVFVKAQCNTCHVPPAFTNLGALPMSVLFPEAAARLPEVEMLDTPSLLSVGATAPYLDDGRANTLQDVISRENTRNLHGDTRALTKAERADLITFLLSL